MSTIVSNNLFFHARQSVLGITNRHLSVSSDADTTSIIYTLTAAPSLGRLQVQEAATSRWVDLAASDTFTQRDIDDNHLRFVADEAQAQDTNFIFSVGGVQQSFDIMLRTAAGSDNQQGGASGGGDVVATIIETGDGNDVVVGTSGSDYIDARYGDDEIDLGVAVGDRDEVVYEIGTSEAGFVSRGGGDKIRGFEAGEDKLLLNISGDVGAGQSALAAFYEGVGSLFEVRPDFDYATSQVKGLIFVFAETIVLPSGALSGNILQIEFATPLSWVEFIGAVQNAQSGGYDFDFASNNITSATALQALLGENSVEANSLTTFADAVNTSAVAYQLGEVLAAGHDFGYRFTISDNDGDTEFTRFEIRESDGTINADFRIEAVAGRADYYKLVAANEITVSETLQLKIYATDASGAIGAEPREFAIETTTDNLRLGATADQLQPEIYQSRPLDLGFGGDLDTGVRFLVADANGIPGYHFVMSNSNFYVTLVSDEFVLFMRDGTVLDGEITLTVQATDLRGNFSTPIEILISTTEGGDLVVEVPSENVLRAGAIGATGEYVASGYIIRIDNPLEGRDYVFEVRDIYNLEAFSIRENADGAFELFAAADMPLTLSSYDLEIVIREAGSHRVIDSENITVQVEGGTADTPHTLELTRAVQSAYFVEGEALNTARATGYEFTLSDENGLDLSGPYAIVVRDAASNNINFDFGATLLSESFTSKTYSLDLAPDTALSESVNLRIVATDTFATPVDIEVDIEVDAALTLGFTETGATQALMISQGVALDGVLDTGYRLQLADGDGLADGYTFAVRNSITYELEPSFTVQAVDAAAGVYRLLASGTHSQSLNLSIVGTVAGGQTSNNINVAIEVTDTPAILRLAEDGDTQTLNIVAEAPTAGTLDHYANYFQYGLGITAANIGTSGNINIIATVQAGINAPQILPSAPFQYGGEDYVFEVQLPYQSDFDAPRQTYQDVYETLEAHIAANPQGIVAQNIVLNTDPELAAVRELTELSDTYGSGGYYTLISLQGGVNETAPIDTGYEFTLIGGDVGEVYEFSVTDSFGAELDEFQIVAVDGAPERYKLVVRAETKLALDSVVYVNAIAADGETSNALPIVIDVVGGQAAPELSLLVSTQELGYVPGVVLEEQLDVGIFFRLGDQDSATSSYTFVTRDVDDNAVNPDFAVRDVGFGAYELYVVAGAVLEAQENIEVWAYDEFGETTLDPLTYEIVAGDIL